MTASPVAWDAPRMAAATAPAGLFLLDAAGAATFVNARLADLLGAPAESLLGEGLVQRLLGERCVRDAAAIAVALDVAGSRESVHHVSAGAAGREWLRVLAERSELAAGIVGVVEDVTGARQADARRARAGRLECLGVLAGGIAHDFNNLLVGIVGNAALAELDVPEGSDAAAALDDLRVAAERATELTGQLLFFSGRGAAPAQPVDVRQTIDDAIDSLDAHSRERIARQYAPDLPAATCDLARLRELTNQLVMNALEATEATGDRVTVSVGTTMVDEARRRQLTIDGGLGTGPAVSIEVSDQGAGMSAETLDRAFEPWATTKTKRRGLGLATVVGTLRAYRGALEAVSAPGVGTTMRALLPTVEAPPPADAPMRETRVTPTARATVLVVDDEPAVREVTRRLLARQGFEVLEACSGAEGVRMVAESRTRLRCVLLDMSMPGMDGVETLRRMREVMPSVRAVMTSGLCESELRELLAGQGAAGYLEKPFDIAALMRAVRAAIDG